MEAIPLAASVVGGLIQSDSAEDAAASQRQGVAESNALQKYMFDQQRSDSAPQRNLGAAASNMLGMYLGLQPAALGGPQAVPTVESYGDLRSRLLPQFQQADTDGAGDVISQHRFTNEQALEQAIRSEMARQQAAYAAYQAQPQQAPAAPNPLFGSLLKPFTGADLVNEPGYQFGLQQGQQAIDRSAASKGGLYSGATMKALNRFGQDYGGTKFGDAFNRDMSSKTQQYNFLSNAAGLGNTANNQSMAAGANYANAVGNNALGMGNVSAANALTQGTIWGNMINKGTAYGERNGWFSPKPKPTGPTWEEQYGGP